MSERNRTEGAPAEQTALAELVSDDGSRRKFLRMVGAGGAASLALLIAACGDDDDEAATAAAGNDDSKAKTGGDLEILNYALTLEYLEADFYDKVVASGMFAGSQQDLLKRIGDAEAQHVAALTAAVKNMGGKPAARPNTKFPLGSKDEVVQLAATVEDLGAAAYLGQATNIQSKEVLAAALAIHSVEARHAAALNTLAGKTITPDGAFAKPASMEEVLPKVKPFIVS
jgi:rubrerythrin